MRSKYFIFFILTFSAVFSSIFPAYTADDEDGGTGVKTKQAAASEVRPGKEEERKTSQTTTTGSIEEESIEIEANSSSVFIIGGVGQGNLQAAIIDDFAFLYDAGTSSQTILKKIADSRGARSTLFLKRKIDDEVKQKKKLPKVSLRNVLEQLPSEKDEEGEGGFGQQSDSEQSMASTVTNAKGETETVSEVDFLRSLFIDRNIKTIMCWVSHADIDHYNLVNKLIPKEATAFFFLCGDFLNLKERNGLNRERKTLLKFISERKGEFGNQANCGDTHVSLPYYWGSENYGLIHDYVLRFNPESDDYNVFKGDISPGWPPYFSGTFEDLMNSNFNSGNFFGEMKADLENFFREAKEQIPLESLKLIHVWSINHVSSKPNNRCPVVSISLPEIEMSFVCTGDANDDVFGHIYQNGGNQLQERLKNYLWSHDGKALLTLFVIPHHGSISNYSKEMLLLFLPNVLAISAGSGTMYGHPDHELIRLFKNVYKEEVLQGKAQDFWSRYTSVQEHKFLSFEKEKQEDTATTTSEQVTQGEQKATKIKAYGNEMHSDLPILSTNVAGTIHITAEGITSQYANHVICGLGRYKVNFKRALRSVEELPETLHFEGNEYSVDPNNPCYFLSNDKSVLILKVEHESSGKKSRKKSGRNALRNKYYKGSLIPGGVVFQDCFYHISYEESYNIREIENDGSFLLRLPTKSKRVRFFPTDNPRIFLTKNKNELIIQGESGDYYLGRPQ